MLIDTNPAAIGRKTTLADIDMRQGKNCHMFWPPCNPRLGAARDVTTNLCNTLLAEELRKLQIMPVSLAVVDLYAYTKEDFIVWHTKEKKKERKKRKEKERKKACDGLYCLMTASISFDEKDCLQSCFAS